MTRKHYRAIAQAIKESKTNYSRKLHKDILIDELCIIFARDNSLFSRQRFINACE